jgi:glyoxylase-like metal-dependent hydrolase (beta-lactamase superfamily II)
MSKLTRRHFLQAAGAAGAVSALSVAGPLLGGASIARAQQNLIGRVLQMERSGIKIHSYIAPDVSASVTSHVIETPNTLIVIDAQLTQTFAREFRAYVDGIGKPIDRVILTHEHPDHFLGGNVFEDVPFVTTNTVAANVQAYIDAGNVASVAALIGESEVPEAPRAPEGGLEAGDLTIDGVTLSLSVETNAEAPETLVIRVPDASVIVLGDLLYNNMHFFPGLDRANWISILQSLRDNMDGYDTLLPGHGLPTTRGELDIAIEYLTFASEAAESAASADEVISALQSRYPGFEGTGLLGFWGLFIQ